MTPEQIELHRMVIKHIEAEPGRWSQANWISGTTFLRRYADMVDSFEGTPLGGARSAWQELMAEVYDVEQCGTTMCYAGWACHIAGYPMTMGRQAVDADGNSRPISDVAQELLGLSSAEADELFAATAAYSPLAMKRLASRVTGIEFD